MRPPCDRHASAALYRTVIACKRFRQPTLDRVDRFDPRRTLEPIGNRPPAEAEAAYSRQSEHTALAA